MSTSKPKREPQRFLVTRRRELENPDGYSLGAVLSEMARAAAALAPYAETSAEGALPADALSALSTAFTILDEVTSCLPPIEAWCVVKHYLAPGWSPAVWIACTTKGQADAFAVAIAKHYGAVDDSLGRKHDRFLVERKPALIAKIVHPDLTPEQYLETLGKH